jgi:hypothetical protein
VIDTVKSHYGTKYGFIYRVGICLTVLVNISVLCWGQGGSTEILVLQ